jgi:polysaccharide pyruvyl transferase CsaB
VEHDRLKVGISGSYGGLNLGDEAILHVILAELRRAAPVDVTVFSRDAEDTRRRHKVEQVVEFRGTPRSDAQQIISSLDLFILGGGGILFDGDADMYLREVLLAHAAGTPVMVYAVSVGPLLDAGVRARVRAALDGAAAITVRDRYSRQLLEEIGVQQEILVTADPAVLLSPDSLSLDEILRAEAMDPHARLIGFSVREPGPAAPTLHVEHYHRLLANAADFMVSRLDAEVVFVPLEQRTFDAQHSHAVVGRMTYASRATVLKRRYTPGQLLSLLEHFDFAVGMRLHFLIFSALAGVPFVALPYASKVTGLIEDLRMDPVALDHISAGALIANIDRAWDQRDELRAHTDRALRELQERARANTALAVELLRCRRRVPTSTRSDMNSQPAMD